MSTPSATSKRSAKATGATAAKATKPAAKKAMKVADADALSSVLDDQLAGRDLTEAEAEAAREEASKRVRNGFEALEGAQGTPKARRARSKKSLDAEQWAPVPRANGELYYPREIPGTEKSDVRMLQEACAATTNPDQAKRRELFVLLGGAPGCGKTACVEAAFPKNLVTVEGNGELEVGDLMGNHIPDPDRPGSFLWLDGPVVQAMKQGLVLFVDDATLIPPNVIARLYPAMDGRRKLTLREHMNEEIVAEPGFYVVMAYNPDAPGSILAEPLDSRCRLQLEVPTDLSLCEKLGIGRAIKGVAQELYTLRDNPDSELEWVPQMRELIAFRDLSDAYGEEVAARNMLNRVKDPDDRKIVAEKLTEKFASNKRVTLEPLSVGAAKSFSE